MTTVSTNPALVGAAGGLAANLTKQALSARGFGELCAAEATVAGGAISLASIAIVGSFAIAWTVIARRRLTDKKQTSSIDPK